MTQKKILRYAWLEAVSVWNHEREILQQLPDNSVAQARERRAWADAEEIHSLLLKAEAEEN